MVRMSDVTTWWQYMPPAWRNFNGYSCRLDTIQSDMPPGQFKIIEKSYSTNAPPSNMPTKTVKLYQAILLLRCQCNSIRHACCVHLFKYACLSSAALSCKTSGLLQIHQTCLPVRCHSHGFVKFVGYYP